LPTLLVALWVAWPAAVSAQEPSPGEARQAQDTSSAFLDPAAAALMRRAREARHREIEGLSSYEGLLREHIYVGLTAFRFRRERSLFEQERIARLRWSEDGERAIQWLGARQAIPIVGADTRRDEVRAEGKVRGAGAEIRDDLRRELPDQLLRETDVPAFAFDPAGDRLAFGEDWALHPLADSADAHYRYASGDTLRVSLPDARQVVLYEIRVEPREADFHLVAGSLWFDAESASLVRATYKPARPFNLLLDEPEDAEDVPGFLQPVEADFSYITVEYSLYEFRYWLPRRFAMEGEARLGRLVRIPITLEWNVRDYAVNEEESQIPVTGPLPPGWSRSERRVEDKETGKVSYVTVVVPERDQLFDSPELSRDFGERTPTAFTDQEIDELKGELETLLPTYQQFRPRVAWGLERGMVRYNRVEGLSVGGAVTVPLTPTKSLDTQARIGFGDWEPNVTATLWAGPEDRRWRLEGYHRLESMGDWSDPFLVTTSLENLAFGNDHGQYYRATGGGVGYRRSGKRVRLDVEGFYEAQRSVSLGTDFFLLQGIRHDTVDALLPAQRLDVGGVRGTLGWFHGLDPNGLIVTGTLLGEAAEGDASYRRAAATLSLSHPLVLGLAGAAEVGAGAMWGDEPIQRQFFLGGSSTLRGFDTNQIRGPAFWRARAEIASGFVGARIALFSDAAWAGPRDAMVFDDPFVSTGVGASFLDGLVRLDLARGVRRGSDWKLHLYLDGLF
jgi:hypothetical protein